MHIGLVLKRRLRRLSQRNVARLVAGRSWIILVAARDLIFRRSGRVGAVVVVFIVVVFVVVAVAVIPFSGLPGVAVIGTVDICIPSLAPRLVALHIVFVVEDAVSAGATFGHILSECGAVVIWQGALTARLNAFSLRDRDHLRDSVLLGGMAAHHFAVLLDDRPAAALLALIGDEVWHQLG